MRDQTHSFFSFRASLSGLLVAAGLVAGISSLLGFMGRLWWFFDLFSHFRIQYCIGLAVVAAALCALRKIKTAGIFAVLALLNLLFIVPLFFGRQAIAGNKPTYRAMLLNVNTRMGNPELVLDSVRHYDPDILVLEEISHSWLEHLALLTNTYPYSVTEPREDNFGIGLYSKFPFSKERIEYIGSAGVPSVIATVRTDRSDLDLIATHPVPPAGSQYSGWRNEQLKLLPEYIAKGKPTLLMGDLNAAPWNTHIRQLICSTDLRDSSKGFGVKTTWPSYMPLLRIPIDHILHSKDIIITYKTIGDSVDSDHYPVIVDFAMPIPHDARLP